MSYETDEVTRERKRPLKNGSRLFLSEKALRMVMVLDGDITLKVATQTHHAERK